MLRRILEIAKSLFLDRVDTVLAIMAIALAIEPIWPSRVAYFAIVVLGVLFVRVIVDVKKTAERFRDKHIPIAILAGRDRDEAHAMMGDVKQRMARYNFDQFSYEKHFDIPADGWIVQRETDLTRRSQEWVAMVHKVEQHIIRLNARLPGKKILHLFINGPAALALGIGAVLGTKHDLVIHHYENGTDGLPYVPVIETRRTHRAKTSAEMPYQYVSVEFPSKYTSTVLVSLALASHPPTAFVQNASAMRNVCAVYVKNTYNNTLLLTADWMRAAQEVGSVLLGLTGRAEVKTIEIYLSMPVALALAIGTALGTQSNFDVFNWFSEAGDSGQYHSVLTLKDLRRSR